MERQKQKPKKHSTRCSKVNNAIISSSREVDLTLLLNILPEDVWRIILEIVVHDANDYFRLSGASQFFRNLMAARRAFVLLTPVVQVMLRHQKRWEWTQDRWDFQATGEDPRIHLKTLTDCRLVCRAWKKSIEGALHNLHYHYQFMEELDQLDYQFPIQVFQKYSEIFRNETGLTLFKNYFRDSHFPGETNPFITRAVEIRIPFGEEELHEFLFACWDVLRQCGKHIWYLTIRGDLDALFGISLTQFSRILIGLLVQLPNLKSLRIDILGNSFKSWEQLHCTFPPLPEFVFLDVLGLPFQTLQAILRSANPAKVGVTFHDETYFNCEAFCQACASVSKLRIDLHETRLYWDGIFSNLETQLGEKLTWLSISLPQKGLLKKGKKFKLPHLKLLDLKLEEAVPLDFLMGMANSLEEITVKVRVVIKVQDFIWLHTKQRKLRVYKAVQYGKLCMSNVWELIPNLKKFSIGGQGKFSFVVKSTREEYESNLKNLVNSHQAPENYMQEETYSTILGCSRVETAGIFSERKRFCSIL